MDSPCGGGPAVRRSGRKSANVEPAQENQRIAGDGRRAGTGVDPADHRRRQGERSGYPR
jgi:hypothetical protein